MAEPSSMIDHKLLDEHNYDGMRMPGAIMASTLDRIKQFEFKDDIVIASYPKTGTSWVQELTWIIYHDGDFDTAKRVKVEQRVPFLDIKDVITGQRFIDLAEAGPRPALLKTHLPAPFFTIPLNEKKAKYIIIVRNPKDVLISYYYFYKSALILGKFKGTFDEFFDMATQRGLMYGDFFHWYQTWWAVRDNPNVLFVKYEDMHKNLGGELQRIASFLGKTVSGEYLDALVEHGSFEAMKVNKMTNYTGTGRIESKTSPYMRSGKVGQWKTVFSEEQNRIIEEKYNKHFKSIGLHLDFE